MSSRPQDRWVEPLRDLLSAAAGKQGRTRTGTTGYFCRTCGTTYDDHHATCPDCGSQMLEPTDDHVDVTD
jgi:hypothetical protein